MTPAQDLWVLPCWRKASLSTTLYWLKRYPTTASLMYRMGWSEEKEIKYYSEFLGLADQIDDEDMVTTEDKSRYEQRIFALESDKAKANELVKELIQKVSTLQQEIRLKQEC